MFFKYSTEVSQKEFIEKISKRTHNYNDVIHTAFPEQYYVEQFDIYFNDHDNQIQLYNKKNPYNFELIEPEHKFVRRIIRPWHKITKTTLFSVIVTEEPIQSDWIAGKLKAWIIYFPFKILFNNKPNVV